VLSTLGRTRALVDRQPWLPATRGPLAASGEPLRLLAHALPCLPSEGPTRVLYLLAAELNG